MKIFDEAYEPSIKSRTIFTDANAEKMLVVLKEKYGFIPIRTTEDLSVYAPLNE